MEWKSATIADVIQIVKNDLANCTPEQSSVFEVYRVDPYLAPITRFGDAEHVVVIARNSNEVIYWEDVEEGFGRAEVDANGLILEQDCNQNDLGSALNPWIK